MAKLILDEPKKRPYLVLDEPEIVPPVSLIPESVNIEQAVDRSVELEIPVLTALQIDEPLGKMLSAVPDPKDIAIELPEDIETPMVIKEAEPPKKKILEKMFGFRYPPKPPDWDRASLIERFNFITLPISDVLGRIGGKIASGWRLMTKEDVQKTLAHELADDLEWYQKTPEAIGWTSSKVAEFIALKGIFKVSGLHKALTVTGQKLAAPFIAKEITAAGGMKAVSTMSSAGVKGLVRKGMTSFLLASPENTAFISSWSAFDAAMKGEDVKEAAISGAGWGLALTAGFAAIAPATQAPELRLAFKKAMANVGQRFPSLVDRLGKAPAKEVQKEWLKALSKSRGKDLRLIDLSVRERAIFRNAIRAAEREILKAAEKEAAIRAYWVTKAAKAKKPPVSVVPEKPVVITKEPAKAWAKRSKIMAKGIEKEIKAIDLYQDVLRAQAEQAEKFAVGTIFFEKKYKGEVDEAIESHPSLKFHITYDKTKGAAWDGIIQERLGAYLEGVEATAGYMDVSEFLEKVAEVTEVKEKIGQLNVKALDALAESGDIKFETLAAKYDMMQKGYTAEEINEGIMEIAERHPEVPAEYIETLLIPTVEAKPVPVPEKPVAPITKPRRTKLLTEDEVHSIMSESLDKNEYAMYLQDEVQARTTGDQEAATRAFDKEAQIMFERGYLYNEKRNQWARVSAEFKAEVEKAKPKAVEAKAELIEKKADDEGLLALSDKEFTDFLDSEAFVPALKTEDRKIKVKGFAAVPKYSVIKEAYNRAHDWILTFGEAKREAPELYDKLMAAYGKRNAGVEKAIDQVSKIIPQKITLADDVLLATTYEDVRLDPPERLKDTYDKFANLLDELEKKQRAEGLFQRPFQERMIEENNIKIAKLTTELQFPSTSKRIKRLRDENEKLKYMKYLSHSIVAKRTIESKLNTLKGDKRTAFISKLTAFYTKRTGKMFLKTYMVSGLITKEDIRMSRLATEELADYYVRSAYKSLYDYAQGAGYIKPTSEGLRAEGWLNQKELGITAIELKDKLVHPLFGSALAEMKAMRKGRGDFLSQIFGMVKQGQFIKPTIIWTYNIVQKYMKGMYSLNPAVEAKSLVRAAKSVWNKDELYHELNTSNLYQFPYEVSRGAREEEISKFIHQHSAEIDKLTKIIEKTTDTSWIDPDMTAGKVVRNIIMAAHRAVAKVTWSGDKIQRTQSYLILRNMGYTHDEAVKVASASHGGYSLLSEKYKKYWSKKLFVYSFRLLMPHEMSKIVLEPIIAAKDTLGGKGVPRHKWERMVKAVIGTAFIPLAIDEYLESRGFEKEGKHLGPLAWKWKKTVMVDGKKREIVVGVNDILNMPVKYWNRITRYNPIRPESRAQQAFENLLKWELHPLYRIFFWDINENRRSFGTGVEVYDKSANPIIQTGQVAKYIFGQSFRFWGGMMDAIGEGSMTEKERREQEKIFDSALSGLDKFLFTALGYVYTRQPIEERQAIMGKYLQKELTSRQFEIARKYEGEELDRRVAGLRKWAEKCENWIKKME